MKSTIKTILTAAGLIAVLGFSCKITFADPPSTAATAPPGNAQFVDVLTAAVPAWVQPHRLLLYVNRDGEAPRLLPPSADGAAADLTTPDGVAAAYGLQAQWFGRILAITPSTMTVLNTDPSLPELPLGQLATAHPIPFLLASLTQAQFNMLSTTGLGMNDLTPDQQLLFRAILPNPFKVVSSDAVVPTSTQADLKLTGSALAAYQKRMATEQKDYADETLTVPQDDVLQQVRLHAYLNEQYIFNGDYGVQSHQSQNYSSGDRKLTIDETEQGSPAADAAGAQLTDLLVSQQPNIPKPCDLVWSRKELSANVSVVDVKTVQDLINSLKKATHLELYADPSYASEQLYLAGDTKYAQPAANIMQALALCVCGTWRQVGAAFVLTDDVVGYGTRQQLLRDVASAWSNRLQKASMDVGTRLASVDWMANLDPFPGDSTALPKDQLISICGKNTTGNVPWKDVPAGLEKALIQRLTDWADNDDGYSQRISDVKDSLKPDSSIEVVPDIEVALDLPHTGVMSLSEYRVNNIKTGDYMSAPGEKIALLGAKNGIICAPKSADEAKNTVDKMASLGLNTLYLSVFNNGRSYFDNSAIPPQSDAAAQVLPAALLEASSKGIAVYAVVDTFCWRKDGDAPRPEIWPSSFDEDLNVFGESSDKGAQRRIEQHAIGTDLPSDLEALAGVQVNQGWVSPLDPTVRQVLPTLTKSLAVVPGLAGIVFQDTAPPGYDSTQDRQNIDIGLGYNEANRLAFLRSRGVDPIDIGEANDISVWLPFEGWQGLGTSLLINGFGEAAGSPEATAWDTYRQNADLSLLKECFMAARNAKPKLPLFMRERALARTIDPWTDPTKVDQTDLGNGHPLSYINSDSTYTLYAGWQLLNSADSLAKWVNSYVRIYDHGKAAGIALDLETGAESTPVPELLDRLSDYLNPVTNSPSTH
jgi:hypothetical protein